MNAATAQRQRIVFTGPDEASATRAIATISDARVTRDDCEIATVDTSVRLRLDHGILRLAQAQDIHLYGTPPGTAIDTVTDFVREGGMGLIVLLDNKRPYPLRDLHFYLHTFQGYIADTSVAVGLSNIDSGDRYSIDDYAAELVQLDLHVPVFAAEVDDKTDVVLLVKALLLSTQARQTLTHL